MYFGASIDPVLAHVYEKVFEELGMQIIGKYDHSQSPLDKAVQKLIK